MFYMMNSTCWWQAHVHFHFSSLKISYFSQPLNKNALDFVFLDSLKSLISSPILLLWLLNNSSEINAVTSNAFNYLGLRKWNNSINRKRISFFQRNFSCNFCAKNSHTDCVFHCDYQSRYFPCGFASNHSLFAHMQKHIIFTIINYTRARYTNHLPAYRRIKCKRMHRLIVFSMRIYYFVEKYDNAP